MHNDCLFCAIASDSADPSMIAMDDLTMTLIHRGQWHHAHFLVVPRQHIVNIRDMEDATIEALMRSVTRVAQAIDMESPGEQISIWKSGGHASGSRHAYFHVHPRCLVRASSGQGVPHDDLAEAAAGRWRMRFAGIQVDHRPLMPHPGAHGRIDQVEMVPGPFAGLDQGPNRQETESPLGDD